MNRFLKSSIKSEGEWWGKIEKTGWLQILSAILLSSQQIANTLRSGRSALVHCSDGWDRTPQMLSLAQILVDPYYRTIEGFIVLIEKDFISFGHQFSARLAHGVKNAIHEISPIFIQFLDCVHQIWVQYPTCFDFNLKFLFFIAFHCFSLQYGTFLFNNEKVKSKQERSLTKVRELTTSIWSYVYDHIGDFKNYSYFENNKFEQLDIDHNLGRMKIWHDYFFQWNSNSYFQYKKMSNFKIASVYEFVNQEIKSKILEYDQQSKHYSALLSKVKTYEKKLKEMNIDLDELKANKK